MRDRCRSGSWWSVAVHACAALPLAGLATGLIALSACSTGERVTPEVSFSPRPSDPVLRGTIGTMATTTAGQPVLVSGYGIVVGLAGTGGGVLPEPIAATMEREMSLRGIGRAASHAEGSAMRDPITGLSKTPAEVLRDPNVAVVLVQGVVARAAPEGFEFDLAVRALNATSLVGGSLWSTDLRLGPPSSFGGVQTRRFGVGRGPIFVNPFSDPASAQGEATGRVLAGGVVSDPLAVQIAIDPPSHSRARQIEQAIRMRFAQGRYDPGPIARARDDRLVDLLVPFRWRDRPSEFLRVVEHLQADMTYPEEHARRYLAMVRDDPSLGETVSLMLWALGDRGVVFARELYREADPRLRMCGLRAGAKLGDPMVADGLIAFAQSKGQYQLESIVLLGEIDSGPAADMALRDLAASGPLTARASAYEALARRAERAESGSIAETVAARRLSNFDPHSTPLIEELTTLRLSGTTIQGIERRTVGGRFVLDRVPWGDPLVYVTQQNRPRIVIFGDSPRLPKPVLVSLWEGRLMMVADSASDPLRLSYTSHRSGRAVVEPAAPERVDELVRFLGHRPTPEDPRPGLDLSFAEVVAALAAMSDAGRSALPFATEDDRLIAAIAQARASRTWEERPETEADLRDRESEDDGLDTGTPPAVKPQVVPLPGATGQQDRGG